MCKTTLTHYTCLCIHLVVHSCILNFPLGRLVCGPPHLTKKDIYIYAKCDDCTLADDERKERAAKRAGGAVVGNENAEGGEAAKIERAGGCEEEEGEICEVKRDLMLGLRGNGKGEKGGDGDDDELSAAQLAIQSEIEESEGSVYSDGDIDDDVQAEAQLLSTLNQEEGGSEKDGSGGMEIEAEGEDGEYMEHVEQIMMNLGKLQGGKREIDAQVDPMDIEQKEEV